MQPEFSIIINRYDQTKPQHHMTLECLAEIRKYTDEPYEIIIVDNDPVYEMTDPYGVLRLDEITHIKQENHTVYESYNIGARQAKSDAFVFMQTDVFCHEKTINNLVKYLMEFDVAFPQQVPMSREDTIRIMSRNAPDATHIGGRGAGMIAITRHAFESIGGWDGRFRNLLGEKALFQKIDEAGFSWTDRTNSRITHIMAGHNLRKEQELYDEEMHHDAQLGKEEYGWG